jgi:virulence-associated protein VapD
MRDRRATPQSITKQEIMRCVSCPRKESEVTYADLVKRLKKHGFQETEASITMKLKRGTFAATFFLAALAALEMEGMRLEDL